MSLILRAEAIRKVFGAASVPVVALDGVTLTVEAREFVALMGPSGCGKSTLLHILGGLERPSEGAVYFGDERVDTLSEAAWARRRRRDIGYVFQFFNLIGNLSAADNIEIPALVAGVGARKARSRAKDLLGTLGIADRARATPAELSGGEQQRVAIARALVNSPAILLADEPTGNLDSEAATAVLGVLKEEHRQGQTILMVTHDDAVAAAAQRIIRMRDGRVVDEVQIRTVAGT